MITFQGWFQPKRTCVPALFHQTWYAHSQRLASFFLSVSRRESSIMLKAKCIRKVPCALDNICIDLKISSFGLMSEKSCAKLRANPNIRMTSLLHPFRTFNDTWTRGGISKLIWRYSSSWSCLRVLEFPCSFFSSSHTGSGIESSKPIPFQWQQSTATSSLLYLGTSHWNVLRLLCCHWAWISFASLLLFMSLCSFLTIFELTEVTCLHGWKEHAWCIDCILLFRDLPEDEYFQNQVVVIKVLFRPWVKCLLFDIYWTIMERLFRPRRDQLLLRLNFTTGLHSRCLHDNPAPKI